MRGPARVLESDLRLLAAGPQTTHEARWFLIKTLGDRLPWERVQVAASLTTGSTSNTARHGSDEVGAPIEVKAEARGDEIRVTVHDQGSGSDPRSVIEETRTAG
jgi:hypothetical protein